MRQAGVAVPKYALKNQIDWDGELEILDVLDDGVNRVIKAARLAENYLGKKRVRVLFEPHIVWMSEGRLTLQDFERAARGESRRIRTVMALPGEIHRGTEMRSASALSRLKNGELCIVTTKDGEHEVRWSVQHWCFFYLSDGTPIVCRASDIDEWRPASIPLS